MKIIESLQILFVIISIFIMEDVIKNHIWLLLFGIIKKHREFVTCLQTSIKYTSV